MSSTIDNITYLEKLRDPRWQRKRLEILQRDNWTCQRCSRTEDTLTVHHRFYIDNTEPWNYPDWILITLCDACHKAETYSWGLMPQPILEIFKTIFWGDDVARLMSYLSKLPPRSLDNEDADNLVMVIACLCTYPHIAKEMAENLLQLAANVNKEKGNSN